MTSPTDRARVERDLPLGHHRERGGRTVEGRDRKRWESMSAIKDELKELVAQSGRDFFAKGLTWGRDAGDTSVRDPETGYVYILPMPSPTLKIPTWATITANDVAVVDTQGRTMGDADVHPTVELLTHLRIYEGREDANALVHSHGRWTRVFAAARQQLPVLMMDQFKYTGASDIRCASIGPAGSDAVARSAVECLGDYGKVVLLAAHGAVCLGDDMEEAMSVAEIAEDLARLALSARLLGDAPQVTFADFMDEADTRQALMHREI
jgi:ribulose-5-phosphate 4-epimerase/fuculose-1-phosphate aldolase